MTRPAGILSLSPLLVFIVLYLGTSIACRDFYKMPVTVAFLVAAVYAVAIMPGSVSQRVKVFSAGAGDSNLMLMLWIFILAGAFAQSAKDMGAVDATVSLTLRFLPGSFLLPGIFIAACLISLSVGTSVGTIAALTPVAVGIADSAGLSVPFVVAIVLGGAYFGDNLSFISDTTIVATQTQGCRMSDKFRVNCRIVLPVALLLVIVYALLGRSVGQPPVVSALSFWKVLPYLVVLLTAVLGVNVMAVLVLGIVLTGVIGMADGCYTPFTWFRSMADGMLGMSELIIMTLLAGGIFAVVQHGGGIDVIIHHLTRHIRGQRAAELCIAVLVCVADICTANNTVAIMTTGPIAADIARRFHIDPRMSASILDTTSCFTQALLPYGAQMLIAATLASVSPLHVLPYLYYPFLLIPAVVLAILFRHPRRYGQSSSDGTSVRNGKDDL